MDRFFVTLGTEPEKEVSKEEFIRAERNAGFRPKLCFDHPDYMTTFATAGFQGNGIYGRMEFDRLER